MDLERGVMSVSINGSFDHPNGTAFDCVRPGPAVGVAVYPALSAKSMKVAVNLGLDPGRLLRSAPLWGRRDNLQVCSHLSRVGKLDLFHPFSKPG